MATLNAKNLTLNDVHHLLKLQEQLNNDSFTTWLSLEPVTEFEQQEIVLQVLKAICKVQNVSE